MGFTDNPIGIKVAEMFLIDGEYKIIAIKEHQDIIKYRITDREKQYLKLLCAEKTSQQIADQFFISPRTVETYRQNLAKRIGVKSTVGLVVFAVKAGIV